MRIVRAEGRAVTIEIIGPAGSTPAVHRIGGVIEAAATVFADVVNASLPERADGSAETADGIAPDTLGRITGPTAQVAYHPRRPTTAALVNPWGRKAWFTFPHLVALLIGLAINAVSVAIVSEALRG
ncbi:MULTISPECIES: hypothetical protein [unclassified Streptomyces]|uniref:hypothetical protein n=1 Tax=unclassified Streptomyces TaxID=2593676 RepID=UPI0037F5C557